MSLRPGAAVTDGRTTGTLAGVFRDARGRLRAKVRVAGGGWRILRLTGLRKVSR